MILQIQPTYSVPNIILHQKNKGIITLAEAIKIRGQKIIKDNPKAVKDFIVKYAKKHHKRDISPGDISNIKFEKMNGEEQTWGLEFLDFEVIDRNKLEDILFVYSEDHINDKDAEDSVEFGYEKTIKDVVSWTLTGGLTIKGGIAVYKGWEINFGITRQTIKEEMQVWNWKEIINLPPKTKTEINALLKQEEEEILLKARWRVTKGTALCSCDISVCGKHNRNANIPISTILSNESLKTFEVYGTINAAFALRAIVNGHSDPYP